MFKQRLFEGEALSPQEIKDNLEAMCTGKKEMNFSKQLTPEELGAEKDNLVQHAVRLRALEAEKKAFNEQHSLKEKAQKQHFNETLDVIKSGVVSVDEEVYEVPDYTNRMMNFYDCNGVFVSGRPMTPDERQRDLERDVMHVTRFGTLD